MINYERNNATATENIEKPWKGCKKLKERAALSIHETLRTKEGLYRNEAFLTQNKTV